MIRADDFVQDDFKVRVAVGNLLGPQSCRFPDLEPTRKKRRICERARYRRANKISLHESGSVMLGLPLSSRSRKPPQSMSRAVHVTRVDGPV